MKIKLDGKDNIIDNMYADLPRNNNSTGKLSEQEKERMIKEINEKVTHDYHNKPALRIKKTIESDYLSEPLTKARVTKYIKRVPKPSGKGYYYFYSTKQLNEYYKVLEDKKKNKFNLFSSIKSLFGFEDEKQAIDKVKTDYYTSDVKKDYGVGFDSWMNHLSEYFKNKSKWDSFFAKKEKKDGPAGSTEAKSSTVAPKKKKTKGPINLSVMKLIHGMYGNIEPAPEIPKPEPDKAVSVEKAKKINANLSGGLMDQIVAMGINLNLEKEWLEKNKLSLIGQKIKSEKDLAHLAQVYRNPQFETFRIMMVDKDDKVVYQTGITSRLPGSAAAFPGPDRNSSFIKLQRQMKASNAVGYYLLHNHPSGRTKASSSDSAATENYVKMMKGFRCHVVVDHDNYTVIDKDGGSTTIEFSPDRKDEFLKPSMESDFLNQKVQGVEDVVRLSKKIEYNRDDYVALIGSSHGSIRSIVNIPKSLFDGEGTEGKKAIREYAIRSGSLSMFLIGVDGTSSTLKALSSSMISEGYLTDVIYDNSESFRDSNFVKIDPDLEFGIDATASPVVDEHFQDDNFDTMPESADISFDTVALDAMGNDNAGFFAEDQSAKYWNNFGQVYRILKSDMIAGVAGVSLGDKTPIGTYDDFIKDQEDNFETMPEVDSGKGSATKTKRGLSIQEATGKIIQNVMDYIDRGLFSADEFLEGWDVTQHMDKDLGKYANNPIVWNAVVAAVRDKFSPTAESIDKDIADIESNQEPDRVNVYDTPAEKDVKVTNNLNNAEPENRVEVEANITGAIKEPWGMTFEEYKKQQMFFRDEAVVYNAQIQIDRYVNILKEEGGPRSGMPEEYLRKKIDMYTEYIRDYTEGKIDSDSRPNPSWDYLQGQYDRLSDKESPGGKSLKRKLSLRTNKARKEHERLIKKAIKEGNIVPADVINEYPEIQKDDARKMNIPDINYKPTTFEKEVFLGGAETNDSTSNKRTLKMQDYSKVKPMDAYLVDEDIILDVPRPSYIPEMDLKDFAGYKGKNRDFDTVRLGPNQYVIVDKRYPVDLKGGIGKDGYRKESEEGVESANYYLMNAETLAATWDYYRKLYIATEKADHEEKQDREELRYNTRKMEYEKKGKPWPYAPFKRTGIRPPKAKVDAHRMTYSQAFMIQDLTGFAAPLSEFKGSSEVSSTFFGNYQDMLRELDYKINDMRIQKQMNTEAGTYKKGQETAYGDKGTKDDLIDSYGVKVKRQNGTEIDDQEVAKLGMLMEDIYSVFGDRKQMSKKYGLKVSYAGEKRMHASKAIGMFVPKFKAISISDTGIEGRGFTFAHEFAHFMDSYLGDGEYFFASDEDGSIENNIASTFRSQIPISDFIGEGQSKYLKRTCECFARAMEQYYAIKQGTEESLHGEDNAGAYMDDDQFKRNIMPLCEKFLVDRNELLKAMFPSGKIFRIKVKG